MTPRLRDVVVEQRNLALRLVDRAEAAPTLSAIGRLRKILLAQTAAEEEVILPLLASTSLGASYGGELHAVLRFVLERACATEASRSERLARLRVLRDLLLHQLERDEHVMVELLSAEVGERAATGAARRYARAILEHGGQESSPFAAAKRNANGEEQTRRERASFQVVGTRSIEGRRTGR